MVMNNAHSLLGVLVGPCCCMHGVASVHVYAHARTHTHMHIAQCYAEPFDTLKSIFASVVAVCTTETTGPQYM